MNQKLENLLNVSFSASKEELDKSDSLSTGYNWRDNTWEIIVKYSGSLDTIRSKYNVYIKELINNYAIMVTDKNTVEQISREDVIDYIEKPKTLYFQLESAKAAACARNVRVPYSYNNTYLTGKNVIVAVIDTGIDIYSNEFRNADGTTRILALYDQTLQKEYTFSEINDYINNNGERTQNAIGVDNVQHGTDVAVIACGKSGVAYESDIIVVKMGNSVNNQFPRTTSLMDAIDYVIRKAVEFNKPVAINISYGCNYGDHRGNTILENFINEAAVSYRCSICIGSGNEADKAIHYSDTINAGQTQTVSITVGEYENSIDIQIWKDYWDDITITLISPSGQRIGIITEGRINRYVSGETQIITLLGEPSPFNIYQEVYINLIPVQDYITSGIWQIVLYGKNIRRGIYNMWLPAGAAINSATGFANPRTNGTITIPSTAANCISVGAYNSYTGAVASFSGRGILYENVIKPDIIAPGVDIGIADIESGITYKRVTGTSYATPFVTGSAALLMQWGIVLGNDRFIYGEKLKAMLINGAKSDENMPQNVSGWGKLCLSNSIPEAVI